MDMNFVLETLERVTSGSYIERGELEAVQEECRQDPQFKGALANAAGFSLDALDLFIADAIQTVNSRLMQAEVAGCLKTRT